MQEYIVVATFMDEYKSYEFSAKSDGAARTKAVTWLKSLASSYSIGNIWKSRKDRYDRTHFEIEIHDKDGFVEGVLQLVRDPKLPRETIDFGDMKMSEWSDIYRLRMVSLR